MPGNYLRLHPRRGARVQAGHHWVFSNELLEIPKGLEAGSVVEARLHDGQSLGVGFYNPTSLIAWRRVSRAIETVDEAFFLARLKEALAFRALVCPGLRSYRLCFGESDGLPGLVIDRYEDVLVIQALSAGIDRRLDEIGAALKTMLAPKGIYLKNDHRSRSLEGLKLETRTLWGEVPASVEIEEGGLKYTVPLSGGQKTGFYFDQRENRAFLRPYFKDRRVVDLYCYTGAFALNAARGGAASVYGIDSSEPAIALAQANAKINELDDVRFDEGDAEEALDAFRSVDQAERPDMILLDPPSLVPSKKDLPKAMRAYVKLNALAIQALPPGGLLVSSTCSHHVSRELFIEMLRQAQAKAKAPLRLLELRAQAADHPVLLAMPETEYLHFALLQKL